MRRFLCCNEAFAEKKSWQNDCWICIELPTEQDNRYLTQELNIPQAFLSDIQDVDERPRIEMEDGWTLMILRIPYRETENDIPYITVPLGMIMKEHYFVTVCHYKTDMLPDFMLHIQRKRLTVSSNWDLTFRLFLSSSVWYLKYLKQINNQTRAVEKELERSIQNAELQRLLKIEKSLVFFITSLRGNDNLLIKLKNLKSQREYFDPDLFEDVEIELRQAQDSARIYSDILSGTMDAFASVISNNLNIIMKRMTALSVLLMIPTLIASLYGMNVPNSLEENSYGFFIIFLISIAFSGIGFLAIRRMKWF
ncbi:MAG: magnesium transporter CorA family protein [Odoribacter splanchnicus]|nr:magnesium transporter CorA family protein [Odoribacter splanchnicus]